MTPSLFESLFELRRYRRALALTSLVALSATTLYCGGDAFTAAPGEGGDDASPDTRAPGDDTGTPRDSSLEGASDDASDDSSDASAGDTSAGDTSSGDSAPAPFSCGAPPGGTIFCADFDTVSEPKGGWDNELNYGGGVVAFDTVDFLSPSRGLATSVGASVTAELAALTRAFTSSATTLDYAFALRVKTLDAVNDATIIAARLAVGSSSASDFFLDFQVDRNGARLHQVLPQGVDASPHEEIDAISASVPLNKWLHVRIVLDRGITPAVRVFVEDVKLVEKPPITSNVKGTKVEVDVGISFVQSPTTGNAISYDNVLVRGL